MSYTGVQGAAVATSPLSIAVPAEGHRPVPLDMATAGIAFGKIAQYRTSGQPLPEGTAATADGVPTTDRSQRRYGANCRQPRTSSAWSSPEPTSPPHHDHPAEVKGPPTRGCGLSTRQETRTVRWIDPNAPRRLTAVGSVCPWLEHGDRWNQPRRVRS